MDFTTNKNSLQLVKRVEEFLFHYILITKVKQRNKKEKCHSM